MDLRVEWMEILMILGSGIGSILAVLLFAVTRNSLSLMLFALGLTSGAVLSLLVDRLFYYRKR